MLEFLNKYAMYLFVLAGLLLGIPAVWKQRDSAGVPSRSVVLLCVLYSVCSVISAMLFAQIESFLSSGTAGGRGAISTYGIYFIGSAMMLIFSKILRLPVTGVMDLYALYAMPSFFMLRLNCLRAGCCYGLPMFNTGLCWPTRETELIFYVVMFVILWRLLRKNEIPGQLFPLLMASYGIFRFVNQWFRDTGTSGFHMSHGWSLLCALIGLSLYFELRAHKVKQSSSGQTRKKR